MEPASKMIDLQNICIHLLMSLENRELNGLTIKLNQNKKTMLIRNYLNRCILFARDKARESIYCETFEATVKRILILQFNGKPNEERLKLNSETYGNAIGGSGRETISRIKKGKETPKRDKLLKLCDGFNDEVDRIFWTNMLLSFFPRTGILSYNLFRDTDETRNQITRDHSVEYDGLKCVIELLESNQLKRARKKLTLAENEKLELLMEEDQQEKDRLDTSLYKTIDKLRKALNMTIERLVVDELYTSTQSWYKWKGLWEEAEKFNFLYMPDPCIKRKYMLAMAVIFDLSYLDMIRFLYQGGYRLGENTGEKMSDEEIIAFFLGNREHAKKFKQALIDMNL